MNTGVRTTKSVIEEFAKYAHETVDMLHARAIELDGNMTSLANETSKIVGMLPEGSKIARRVENNPAKAQLYALLTGVMFTHMMKSRGISFGPTTAEKVEGETGKQKTTRKAA